MRIFYQIARNVCRFVCFLLYSVRFEGLENLPQQGGYIIAAHHITAMDPLFYAVRVPRPFNYMAKEELFRNPLIGALLRALGAFPVERGSGDLSALEYAEQIVKNGEVLAIFPEGTRSRDGKLLKLKLGAIYIAGQTGADVVPATIMVEHFERGLRFRSKVLVRYGKPIANTDLKMNKDDRRSMARASKLVYQAIADLMEDPA